MKSATNQMLFHYWNELRGTRQAPSRLEVDPAHFIEILAETFILEAGPSGTYTFRLAGTRICEQMGYELRGVDFAEMAGPTHARALEDDLTAISASGQYGVFEIECRAPNGEFVTFEALVLPLVHTQGTITRFLGAMSIVGGKRPAWLGTLPLTPMKLARNDLHWTNELPRIVEPEPHQAPFLERNAHARIVHDNRRHFRVFEGGLSASPIVAKQAPRVAK
jgi:hypothetical protein